MQVILYIDRIYNHKLSRHEVNSLDIHLHYIILT